MIGFLHSFPSRGGNMMLVMMLEVRGKTVWELNLTWDCTVYRSRSQVTIPLHRGGVCLLSHTPLWQMWENSWDGCYIFNESAVFDLSMFVFVDAKWLSWEQSTLGKVRLDDTWWACGWRTDWPNTCSEHVASRFALHDLVGTINMTIGVYVGIS